LLQVRDALSRLDDWSGELTAGGADSFNQRNSKNDDLVPSTIHAAAASQSAHCHARGDAVRL
jgi:hypothetical protein